MHQPSAYSELSINHKKSNISFFAQNSAQRAAEKSQQEPSLALPIHFQDLVTIQNMDGFVLLLQPRCLFPCALQLAKLSQLAPFSLFLVVPVNPESNCRQVQMGEELYLLNNESRLYLSAEREIVRGFTGVRFEKEPGPRSIFFFASDRQRNSKDTTVLSRTTLRLRNKAAALEIRMESQNKELSDTKAALWLAQCGHPLLLSTLNRQRILKYVVNNQQTVMIAAKIQSQTSYIGVSKHSRPYSLSQKHQPLGKIQAAANLDFYSKSNCEIIYLSRDWAHSALLFSSLWTISVVTPHPSFPFLAKNNDQLILQHLQTGLYLNYLCSEPSKGFSLESQPCQLTFSNAQRFKCDFSNSNGFQPLYCQHPFTLTHCSYPVQLEVVGGEFRVKLFLHEFLQFLDNLTALLSDSPRVDRQQLELQVAKYSYLYKLLSREVGESADGGYFYFELSLKLLEVVGGLVGGEAEAAKGLKGLLQEMAKFMCVVGAGSEVLAAVTAKNSKRTKEMISLLFVLYPFNQRHTLSLLVGLAASEPHLVIGLLAGQLTRTQDFAERVALLMSIKEVIDQARRITLDQQILAKFLKEEHYLEVQEETLVLHFQEKTYTLAELLGKGKQEKPQHKEQEYETMYLLMVMKLLYVINLMQQLPQEQGRSDRRDCNILLKYLVEQWLQCHNYLAKVTILGFIIEIITSLKQDAHFSQQRFVVCTSGEVHEESKLSALLQLREASLDWLFGKKQLLKYLHSLVEGQWTAETQLVLAVKYLAKVVDLASLLVSTCTFDIHFINELELFALTVASLYDPQENASQFALLRRLLRGGEGETGGLKLQLDILLSKLNDFFVLVLTCKKRLYLHPFNSHPEVNLRFELFRARYAALMLVGPVRTGVAVISKLLEFYRKEVLVEGVGLQQSEGESESMQLAQRVVDGLQALAIIMESFRLYQGERGLRQNLIASIKLKIFNIEEAIKCPLARTPHFLKCSEALDLPGRLLQFILQNHSEHELASPLAELLYERISVEGSLFQLVRDHQLFVDMLQDPHSSKTAKLVLRWVARQIERRLLPPLASDSLLLFQQLYSAIELQEPSHNLLWFVSLMCELGLEYPRVQQLLYAKLVSRPEIQQMVLNCSSAQTLRQYREKMMRDGMGRARLATLSFEFMVIFRITAGIERLETHLLSLLPLKEVVYFLNESEDYDFMKICVSYLNLSVQRALDTVSAHEVLLFCLKGLREYSRYDLETATYSARLQDRQRDVQKAMTQFFSKEPINLDKRASYLHSDSHKNYYWELLLEVPCYARPEGLLICLETTIKQVISREDYQSKELRGTLYLIAEIVKEIKRKEIFESDNMKGIYDQLCLLSNLLELSNLHKKLTEKHELQRVAGDSELSLRQDQLAKKEVEQLRKDQAEAEEIFKKITQNQVEGIFFSQLNKQLASQQPNGPVSQKRINFPIARKGSVQPAHTEDRLLRGNELGAGQNVHEITQQQLAPPQKTQHSTISPQQKQALAFEHKSDWGKQVVQFLGEIKRQMAHKPRAALRLQQLLLYYFKCRGTFENLLSCLSEEINQIRERVVQYKEEVVEYQISYIRREPDPPRTLRRIAIRPQGTDLLRLLELQEQESLPPAIIRCLQQELSFYPKVADIPKYKRYLIKCFRRIFMGQTELSCLLFECQALLQFIGEGEDSAKDGRIVEGSFGVGQEELKNIVSSLAYRVSLIQMRSETLELHMGVVLVLCQALCLICGSFPLWAMQDIHKLILDKMPKGARQQLVKSILEVVIEHQRQEKGFCESMAVSFPLALLHFQELAERMDYNSNLQFIHNLQFIKKTFDFLQLLLSRNSSAPSALFPLDLLRQVIKLELKIYAQMHSGQLQSAESQSHCQEIILLCLSFFHTLSLREGRLLSSTLYYERQFYFDQSFNLNDVRQAYGFYQSQYSWCLLILQGKQVVQAFPVRKTSEAWEAELKRALSQFAEVPVRKEMVINYCLGTSRQSEREEELLRRFSGLAAAAIVVSYVCIVTVSLCQILSFARGSQSTNSLVSAMLSIHLLMLLFMIFYRFLLLTKVGKLEVTLHKERNLLVFILNTKKNLIFFCLLLIGISIYSFSFPGISPLLCFQLGLLGVERVENLVSLAKIIGKSVSIIVLFVISLIFCLALTIDAHKQPGFVLPVFNYASNFDIKYLLVTMRIWSSQLSGDYKACLAALFYLLMSSMVVAFAIYHFASYALRQQSNRFRCQLCALYRSEQSSEQAAKHVDEVHNILKFVRCFKYVLFKAEEQLSLQQRKLTKLLTNKHTEVFG